MFVQVIQGHMSDAAQVRAQLDRWVEEGPWSRGLAWQHIRGY